jgi:hypothetical protein
MQTAPAPLLAVITGWPEPAQHGAWLCRTLFLRVADQTGTAPLDESLKWGQPAWRPRRPRTGSTLRMGWTAARPDALALYVDCKTDLAARMATLYPDLPLNDGRRHLGIALDAPLPRPALEHLAAMTFCYHLRGRTTAPMR